MSSDYDQRLLESVAVRRSRLVAALLYGQNRVRWVYVDGLRRTMVGIVIAALVAAGCVGYSFVRHALAQARAQNQGTPGSGTGSLPSGSRAATPHAFLGGPMGTAGTSFVRLVGSPSAWPAPGVNISCLTGPSLDPGASE